ncbi:MAG: hypothetical protein R3C53_01750 [Pirellulaceae bacterium]
MMSGKYRIGDRVVYTRHKYTSCPGPRAKNVFAAPNGESYEYVVDKFWVVRDVQPDGNLIVETRRGKTHVISSDDPQLRRANLLERLFKGRLFPQTTRQILTRVPSH